MVLGTALFVWLLLQLWQVLLVIVVALMLVGMLSALVERLERRGLKRTSAVLLVFFGIFLVGVGFAALTVPTLARQVSDMFEHFPASQAKVVHALEGSGVGRQLARSVRAIHPSEVERRAQELGMSYGPWLVEVLAYGATAFFLALYIMLDRDRMRGALFAVVPRVYHLRLSRVLVNLQTIVGGYMRGQAITSLLMTIFTLIVLLVAGVPNALALALFAGIADVLPYVGAFLACGPATLAALSQGTTVALIVMLVLAAYQEFESRVIVPRVYGTVLRLPAAWVMISLLVGGKLLGVLGALLALPIAAGIRMMIAELRVELPGEDVDDAPLRAKDAAAEAEFAERAAGQPATTAAAIATELAEERLEEDAASTRDPSDGTTVPITSGAR
ncbi:MAG: family transporter [Labilithrix sp.]|nr:family transporter [Labilithrix sp.]